MLLRICNVLSVLSIISIAQSNDVWFDNSDAFLQVDEIIEKYGYISETHTITTDDGYILETNRIVTKYSGNGENYTKPSVLLIHGFLGYAGNFVINGKRSLGFYLADHGYDVWIGNVRGTRYSKKHKTLDNKSSSYWNFSFHEMAVKDIPANIDYILKHTGNKKISYVGHSQGTTVFFAFLSELPEYNEKVNVMHALAPIMTGRYSKNPVLLILVKYNKLVELATMIFQYVVIDLEKYVTKNFTSLFCVSEIPLGNVCDIILRTVTGLSRKETDQSTLVISHMSTASEKSLLHLGQCQKKFRKYDYGRRDNFRRYGHAEPPSYNLKNIKVPIVLHYGGNDLLDSVRDVEEDIASYLPTVVDLNKIPKYGHLDFLIAEDVIELIYEKLLISLNKYR